MDFSSYKGRCVLVTGATGFAGSAITRKLAESGAIVHAIARPESNRSALADLPVRWFIGQIFDPETVHHATENVEYIFHLATTFRSAGASDDLNRKVHIDGTQLLAKAVTGRPNFKRFVHFSTIGVHSHIAHGAANEDAPFQPDDIYQQTKAEAELWIRKYAAENNVPFTVLRPCGIYGPGEKRFLKFFKQANRRIMLLLGKAGDGLHLIYIDDLVNMALLAAQHPAALNEVFICGEPSNISLEKMAKIIAGELGHSITVIRLPAFPFYVAGYIFECIYKPFGKDPPLHRRRVGFFTKNRSFDTSKIRDRLGYTCEYPDEIGLPLATRWYVANGLIKTK